MPLDLRPGRVMLALGAAGFGSACVAGPAEADLGGAAAPPTVAGLVLGDASVHTPVGAVLAPVLAPVGAVVAPVLAPVGAVLAPVLAPVSAPGGRVALSVSTGRRNLLLGRSITVFGALRPASAGRVVALEERRGSRWATIVWAATTRSGRYSLRFRPPGLGSLALRVRLAGGRLGAPAVRALGAVNVYRLAGASWYGPGGSLACGGSLTATRLGVAHRTLPCGTMVSLHFGNRTVRVPVIDRGPYVAGRDYDLTPATKRALGFGDIGEVWATR